MKIKNHWSDQTIIPAETATYMPISHVDLIGFISAALARAGYTILGNRVQQSADGREIVGTMHLRKDDSHNPALPFCQMFGYMNSYNKRLPIKLAAGAHVFICTNGMVVGDIYSYRKHTSGVGSDLITLIDNAVASIETSFQKAISDYSIMSKVMLSPTEEATLLGRMYIQYEYITVTELAAAVNQLKSPSFDSFKDHSAWSLYNHVTYALNSAPPSRRLNALKSVHKFVSEYARREFNAVFDQITPEDINSLIPDNSIQS